MTQDSPPPRPRPTHHLPYAHYDRSVQRPFGGSSGTQFAIGMGAGLLLSLLVWGIAYAVTGRNYSGNMWTVLAVIVLGLKVAVGVTGLCFPDWRMAGGGLLTSIALGTLICGGAFFAAVCGTGAWA